MKIYTKHVSYWNEVQERYVIDVQQTVGIDYDGPISLCCGATSAQTAAQTSQASFASQTQAQASQVFGNDSSIFQDLNNTFAPTVAAGPSQEGFSAAQLANLKSQAITETGNSYKNARAAVGEAQAAQGGGNNPNVTSGTTTGVDLGLAESAGNQTASEMNQINEADYQQGTTNYNNAVQGLAGAANVFNTTANIDNSSSTASEDSATTANQIAQENNSWIQGVTGALGGVASAATGASINKWG